MTEVALPHHRGLKVMMTWQTSQPNWDPKGSILQGDLKTAFLQAENLSNLVFVRIPKDPGCRNQEDWDLVNSMFGSEGFAEAVQTLYGTSDAPANLDSAVRKSLIERGFHESLSCPNLYRRITAKGVRYKDLPTDKEERRKLMAKGVAIDSWVYVYVDDLMIGTGLTKAIDVALELQTRWKFKEAPNLSPLTDF